MSDKIKIEFKGTSIVFNGIDTKPIKIPSQMYPLNGNINFITKDNSAPFPDSPLTDKIKEIYNSITPGVGTCYTNTEKLVAALNEVGIEAHSMVGWVFIGGDLPVHHCFAAIDNHVLDFSPNLDLLYSETDNNLTIEEARDKLTNRMIELRAMPNSETTTFGQVNKHTLYVASPCKPSEGLKIYQKLMKAYPKHPCYTNIVDGTNETQRMFYKKQGKTI